MKATNKKEINLVDQYLHASCFNKISKSIFKNMLDYELQADPIEKKLIKRIREQVEQGKIVISKRSKEKV